MSTQVRSYSTTCTQQAEKHTRGAFHYMYPAGREASIPLHVPSRQRSTQVRSYSTTCTQQAEKHTSEEHSTTCTQQAEKHTSEELFHYMYPSTQVRRQREAHK